MTTDEIYNCLDVSEALKIASANKIKLEQLKTSSLKLLNAWKQEIQKDAYQQAIKDAADKCLKNSFGQMDRQTILNLKPKVLP